MVKLIRNNIKIPKKKIKKTISTFLLLLIFIIINPNIVGNTNTIIAKNIPIEMEIGFKPIQRDSLDIIYKSLISEVDKYIFGYAPSTKLLPLTFIDVCKKQNFDIVLAMSQAHIESHYGTKGIASRTNSVFNVGTYDDGTIKYRYSDPNHSVEPYTSLMNRNYLRQGKKAADILKYKAFVDYKGDRYASFKFYEYRVKGVYDDILDKTSIDELYKIYTSEKYKQSLKYYALHDTLLKYISERNKSMYKTNIIPKIPIKQ